jgi:hypothetical protein
MQRTYLTIRSLLAPLKFCLEVTAPTTQLPMPIRRQLRESWRKALVGGRTLILIWVECGDRPRGGRLRGGMGIGLSAFRREEGLEYSPQPGAVANEPANGARGNGQKNIQSHCQVSVTTRPAVAGNPQAT